MSTAQLACCHDNHTSPVPQVAKQLGLDRCHHHLTGAAPLSSDTLRYFLSLNILLHKLYGMTETTGPTTMTTEKTLRFGSNGYAIAGVDIKIEEPDVDGVGEVRRVLVGQGRGSVCSVHVLCLLCPRWSSAGGMCSWAT